MIIGYKASTSYIGVYLTMHLVHPHQCHVAAVCVYTLCMCVCVCACVQCDSLFLGTWLICISYLKVNHD